VRRALESGYPDYCSLLGVEKTRTEVEQTCETIGGCVETWRASCYRDASTVAKAFVIRCACEGFVC
jgi:hypothetical protein